MAVDLDGDGIPDVFDMSARVVVMEVARVVDAMVSRRRNEFQAAAARDSRVREDAQRRLGAARETSRASLAPVMREDWWESASVETVGRKYLEARGWAETDPAFRPVVDTIERRAMEYHRLPPERIAEAAVIADREPLTFETARQVATVAAPAWYRADERIVSGEVPASRLVEARESFVKDMTALRDYGPAGFDTEGARREWALHRGTPALVDGAKMNESPAAARERLGAVADQVWLDTKKEREAAMVPRNVDLSAAPKPMSPTEAYEFADRFAPDWLRDAHTRPVDRERPGANKEADRRFDEAMEVLRDTGTLSHPYAEELRFAARDHYGLDSSTGPAPVPDDVRVRFGGVPGVPPISEAAALEMVEKHAPVWYQEPVLAALGEGSGLSAVDRAALLDTTRADMQVLRDTGTLDTPNVRELWASTQDVVAGHSVDAVWVSSAARRADGEPLTERDQQRFRFPDREAQEATVSAGKGARFDPDAPESTDTERLPRVQREASRKASERWDTPARRAETAARIEREFGRDAAVAFRTADASMGARGSKVTAGSPGGGGRAPGRSLVNDQKRTQSRPRSR